MKVSFELTMPNKASWNGKWSGEGKKYFRIKTFTAKEAKEIIEKLFGENTHADFYYRWEDGWGANVRAEIIDAATARKRLKQSAGFCGYEWMIGSIIKHGKIIIEREKAL